MRGIKIPGGGEQKIKAFADDTMIMIDDASVVKVTSKFEDFGAASGNKINIGKTNVMNRK